MRMVNERASDVHLTSGFPPAIRVRGRVAPMEDYPPSARSRRARSSTASSTTTSASASRTTSSWTSPTRFPEWPLPHQRLLPARRHQRRLPPDPARHPRASTSSQLPLILEEFTRKPRGFVLVTGPTGSGKSTSLAAMVDLINTTREEHILTIEDPIEFLHRHKKCIVNQREIGTDAIDFAGALRAGLAPGPRRDPRRGDARHRDDLHGADRRGDGPPRFRDAPHPVHRRRPWTGSSTSSRPASRTRCACSSRSRFRG